MIFNKIYKGLIKIYELARAKNFYKMSRFLYFSRMIPPITVPN